MMRAIDVAEAGDIIASDYGIALGWVRWIASGPGADRRRRGQGHDRLERQRSRPNPERDRKQAFSRLRYGSNAALMTE